MFWKRKKLDLDLLKEGVELIINKQKWIIKEICTYDWSVDGKSTEYFITGMNGEERYLEIEKYKGSYEIYLSEVLDLEMNKMEQGVSDGFITFNGENFDLEESYSGAFKNETNMTSWTPVRSYLFYNNYDKMITIEITDQNNYKSYYGSELKETDVQIK